MTHVQAIISDLRDKRLWPLAVALLVAIIAVPVLLSSGGSGTPIAQQPAPRQLSVPTGVPVVDAGSTPVGSHLKGSGRNPFNQLVKGSSSTTAPGATVANAASGSSGTTGTSTTAGSTSTTSTSTGNGSATTTTTTTTTTPTTTIPTATPKPAPTGLTSTQSYDVELAITNSAGGLDTFDPLERLSVLPSQSLPLLVELGVLKGGNRVLFAVQPGAGVSGPGKCIPGPVDCELLALPQDQTEGLSMETTSGMSSVALFAVTGITAANHGSSAAATKARQTVSAAGRRLLSQSTSSALSLFPYEPSIGALVDLRNLTVGG